MAAPLDHDRVAQPNPAPGEPDGDAVGHTLPNAVTASYRVSGRLPALEAEFSCDIFSAVERALGQSVTLSSLEGLDDTERSRTYDRCTQVWPEHYGIPRVHDAGSPETPAPFIAWAVESGENLRAVFERNESLSRRRSLEIGRAVAETLAELHRFGHSAEHLTPATIWLGPAGICQIVGLGLGAPTRDIDGEGQRYRALEQLRGEPHSMAERVLAGDLAERADVWSLGVILAELLEGRPRLSGRRAEDLAQELNQVPWRPPTHLGHELGSLLSAMLTLDPVYRDISTEEVATRLDDLLIDHQVTAPRSQARTPATQADRSSRSPGNETSPDPPSRSPSDPSLRRTGDKRYAPCKIDDVPSSSKTRRHHGRSGSFQPSAWDWFSCFSGCSPP